METAKGQRALIVPFGSFDHPAGEQVIDGAAAERIVERLDQWGRDIVVDYQHQSMGKCAKAPAAGWVKAGTWEVAERGVEADIEWTDEAAALVEAREYRFLSPVFERTDGEITGLVNLGLTNNPNIHAMEPLVNEMEEERMENDFMAALREKLGLNEDADEEEMTVAVDALVAEKEAGGKQDDALRTVAEMLGAAPEDGGEAVVERVRQLVQKFSAIDERETEALVNDAVASGRLRPGMRQWALDLARDNREALDRYLENSGAAAPFGGVITKETPGGARRVNPSEERVMRMLGVSEEDYLKYGGAN